MNAWDRQRRDTIEKAFAAFIEPRIEQSINERTKALIGSNTPLRWDHPAWGLGLRLFSFDRAKAAKLIAEAREHRLKKSSI
jgi:hypothetical protein